MRAGKLLHNLFDGAIHQSRIKSLSPVIDAIIETKQLNLTALGRGLDCGQERAGIRRIDRLLANPYYQNNTSVLYQAMTQFVLGSQQRPIIIVDWSGLPNSKYTTQAGKQYVLRAALAAQGRSITLYDEVHPKTKENNPQVHAQFLKRLQALLPDNCHPIIVTDGGFKNPWFKEVLSFGWDYIGRASSTVNFQQEGRFKPISTVFKQASQTPKSLGEITFAKTNPIKTNLYIYKKKPAGRKKHSKDGSLCQRDPSKKYMKSHRAPWVLISSLSHYQAAKKIIKIYKMRMTIEEGFRDMKSELYGFSLNENKTLHAKRYNVWLVLCALASLLAWIVGYVAEQNQLHHQFQANTYRHKRVLSFFFLGCQVIRKKLSIPINFNHIINVVWGEEL